MTRRTATPTPDARPPGKQGRRVTPRTTEPRLIAEGRGGGLDEASRKRIASASAAAGLAPPPAAPAPAGDPVVEIAATPPDAGAPTTAGDPDAAAADIVITATTEEG